MVNPRIVMELVEGTAVAVREALGGSHLLEEVQAGVESTAKTDFASGIASRHPVVAQYVRDQLEMWKEKADYPEFEITKFWTKAQLAKDAAFEHAVKAPALQSFVRGKNLDALEIGAQWDVSVPRVLESQLSRYVTVDIHESRPIATAWKARLSEFGLKQDNKFRIVGNSAELPVPSQSHDLVYASFVDPFVFGRGMPQAVKEQSLSEVSRVLRPGGRFLLGPYSREQEAMGADLLSKYFPSSTVHTPTLAELTQIKASEKSSQFYRNVENGVYRTFVGVQKE